MKKCVTFLTEKVYLAPASSHYFRGDTIQVDGQLLSSDYEDFYPYSRYVYIELLNDTDSVLVRPKIKCESNGSFYATLPLDYEWSDNVYYLRGYSQFMQNIPTSYFPTAPLLIGKRQPPQNEIPQRVKVSFFPEGGKWLADKAQKVAVCLMDEYDYPVQTSFQVVNGSKDTIATGESHLSGWGTFTFTPRSGEQYCLETSMDSEKHSYPLPQAQDKFSLQVVLRNGKLVCKVLSAGLVKNVDSHLYAYHPYFGLQELGIQQEMAVADVSGCAPGALTVWLVDSTYQILAERNVWILQEILRRKVSVGVQSVIRPEQMPLVSVHDTLPDSRCILRIVPEQDEISTLAFENLYFRYRLHSPFPFPRFYHREDAGQAGQELEVWLLSTTSAALPFSILKSNDIAYPFAIEKQLLLSGSVKHPNGKPVVNGNVQLFHAATQKAYMATTDSVGVFGLLVDDFADKDEFYVQTYDKKGRTDKYIYHTDEPLFPAVINDNHYQIHHPLYTGDGSAVTIDTLNYTMESDSTKVYNLGGVTVKGFRKDRNQWSRPKTPLNFMDRKTLERPGVLTLEDAIRRLTKVYLKRVYAEDSQSGERENGRVIMWKVPPMSTLNPSLQGHGDWLDLVIGGMVVRRGYEDFLGMSTTHMESIELVGPRDSRCLINDTPFGFIEIKRRTTLDNSEIPSNGITLRPQGISYPLKPNNWKKNMKPGRYRLLIDIISPDRIIESFDKPFVVSNVGIAKE